MSMKARDMIFVPKGGATPSPYEEDELDRERFANRRVIKLRPVTGPGARTPGRAAQIPLSGKGPRGHAHRPAPMAAQQVKKFTLRIDPDRHKRFRLALAIDNTSGQSMLIRLLDKYLEKKLGPAPAPRS